MADRKINCCRCGEQFTFVPKPGRPPEHCPGCTLNNKTAPRPRYKRECGWCGSRFEAFVYWSKWCSAACGKRARKRERPDKAAADYRAKEAARKSRRLADPEHGRKQVVRSLINALRRRCSQLREIEKASRPCGTCGQPIGWNTDQYRYCSVSCRSKSEVTKAVRRKWGYTHAMAKKATTVVPFDPIFVLDRDKWTCQICGVRTPKRLRGKWKWNSPEIDHIVPLSKNGAHILSNVQCTCLRCNRSKGDKTLGQTSMGWAA